MNLGVFLSSGLSFGKLAIKGRDELFKSYLVEYCKAFDKVFVFSYEREQRDDLPSNCFLIENKFNLPRLIYTFVLPLLNKKYLKDCQVLRVMQLTGVVPAILAGKIYKIPVVSTYGYDYLKFALMEKKLTSFLTLKILEKPLLNNLNSIITTTLFLQKKLEAKTKKPIHLIPNSVDTKLFKQKSRIFNKKKIQILAVGRLEKQKNLEELIEAISLSKYRENIYLTIIGKGSLKDRLISLAQKLEVNISIIESVSHNKMAYFYQNADIFCLVSLIEGHPKALLEALSCGLPCLVSKNQGNLSIVEDEEEGLVADNRSLEITSKVDLLIGNANLRKRLAYNGRRKIKRDFDRKKLLKKEITILKNV